MKGLKTTMNNFEKNVEGRDVERLKLKCRNWKLKQILKTTMNLTLDFEKKGGDIKEIKIEMS